MKVEKSILSCITVTKEGLYVVILLLTTAVVGEAD